MDDKAIDKKILRELFGEVVDLAPQEREEYLNRLGTPEPLREELRKLLAADAGAHTFLSSIIGEQELPYAGSGERFGPFLTREQIGAGGMGAVYRAERIDGELSQTVAIKVLHRPFGQPDFLARFARERQLLARLEHPNIARLLDGGTRGDGVAFLVMEFVDGEPLDQYCGARSLSTGDKLRLFLPLCQAVEYAHEQFIVHRDLKPSNVLVTRAGIPKLLDFGIAKALDAPAATQTVVLTPEFGSPEQVRGEVATTRTDVYGLGAVLYFLLTGHPPHVFQNQSLEEMRREICEGLPEKPSSLRPDLKGDLENVLLKALHAEPARRYASARELAEDLERYLAHRPVLATTDSVSYRVSRLVRRHRFACAAGMVAFLAVAAGIAGSLYEAHRAQQRFAQVRELANRFVFDFEASIRDTPGTVAARKMVAETARQYLASLSAEAGGDAGLNRELAESYYRLSRVEFRAGENKESIEHLRTAIAILKRLKDDCCGPPLLRSEYISWTTVLARAQEESQSRAEARTLSAEALDNARRWAKVAPLDAMFSDAMFGRAMIDALSSSGNILADWGQPAQSQADLAESVRYCDRLLPGSQDDELAFSCARAHQWLAGALANLGENDRVLGELAQAQQILDGLLARHHASIIWRGQRAQIAAAEANAYRRLSQKDPSLKPNVEKATREAYAIAVTNARDNPDDRATLDNAFVMTTRLANHLFRENQKTESIPLFLEARDIADQLVLLDPSNRRNLYLRMNNRLLLGAMYGETDNWPTGLKYSLEAERLVDDILRMAPGDLTSQDSKVTILMNLAIAYRHLKKLPEAQEKCRRGLELASGLLSNNKGVKNPVLYLADLREQARILGVPDPTK